MKTIYKYELEPLSRNVLMIPANAKTLSANMQLGKLCLWALVDTDNPIEERIFSVYGTGNLVDECRIYISTVIDKGFVWHVFEE